MEANGDAPMNAPMSTPISCSMNGAWAAPPPLAHAVQALRLWNLSGVEVCVAADTLWLRGPAWDEHVDRAVRSMLGSDRFTVDGDLLIPLGRSLPVDRAPPGPWTPLRQWFELTRPAPGFAAQAPNRAPLALTRSAEPQAANLLL